RYDEGLRGGLDGQENRPNFRQASERAGSQGKAASEGPEAAGAQAREVGAPRGGGRSGHRLDRSGPAAADGGGVEPSGVVFATLPPAGRSRTARPFSF